MKQARSEGAAERRNTGDNGERVGVMYVGCNMVVVAVDNGGGSLLLGRLVGRSVGGCPPPSLHPPRHLSLSLPPSCSPALSPFSRLPREDIKKPTMESAGDGEERKEGGKGDEPQRVLADEKH